MTDDDDLREQSAPAGEVPPLEAIDRALAEIQADFNELAGALEAGDRDKIRATASDLVDAWLLVDAAVQLLDAPTEAARKQLRIARRALWAAGQVVDELFACALVDAHGATADFVHRIRAEVAFVLESGDLSLESGDLS